jgi:hypothetical protein
LQGARVRRRVNTTRHSLCLMHSAGALDQSQAEWLMLALRFCCPEIAVVPNWERFRNGAQGRLMLIPFFLYRTIT